MVPKSKSPNAMSFQGQRRACRCGDIRGSIVLASAGLPCFLPSLRKGHRYGPVTSVTEEVSLETLLFDNTRGPDHKHKIHKQGQ